MKKTLRFALCLLLAAALGLSCAAGALVYNPPSEDESGEEQAVPQYEKTLSGTISGFVEFTTIASKFETNEDMGYYAGELTVNITGPIVIEAGATLAIGTPAVGSTSEARPVIKGALSDTPLIVVKAGGELQLQCADFELSGAGVLIEQQAGGIVSLTDSPLPVDTGVTCSWAGPVVYNSNQPDTIYLESGTPLTAELLPATLHYEVYTEGKYSDEHVPVRWDLEGLAGQTSGEAEVEGTFLDENGEALASAQPLVQRVEWYEPGKLVVTRASWTGDQAVTAALFLDELPEDVSENNIRGETSPDGRTWTAFDEEEFEVTGDGGDGYVAIFYLYDDNEPRYFRLVATDWYSDAFYLPAEDDSTDDQGGNRGGSVSLVPPPREPEPSPEPTPTPTPTPEPTPEPTPTPTPTPTPEPPREPQQPVLDMTASEQTTPPKPAESEAPAEPEKPEPPAESAAPAETPEPEQTPPPAEDVEIEAPELPEPAPDSGMGTGEKIALAAAGAAVVAGVVMAAAGVGPFKRKK